MPCCFRSRISGRRSVARRREHTQVTPGALRCRLTAAPFRRSHASDDWAAITLHAASGRLIPLSANSPTRSTSTAFSIFVSTRGLIRICPEWRRRRAERRHCYKIIVLLWLGIGCCRCCNDGDPQTRSGHGIKFKNLSIASGEWPISWRIRLSLLRVAHPALGGRPLLPLRERARG
jgi:hypothetical protein